MDNLNNSGSEVKFSNQEMGTLTKLLGRELREMEKVIMGVLYQSCREPDYIREMVRESINNLPSAKETHQSVICVLNTLHIDNRFDIDTNEVLLHIAIKGFRIIAQDIILYNTNIIRNASSIEALCKAKNMTGTPVILSKVLTNSANCEEFLIHQNSIGITSNPIKSLTSKVNEGDLVFFAGIPTEFSQDMNLKAALDPETEIPLGISIPLKNKILLEFINDLVASGILKWGDHSKTGMLCTLRNILKDLNYGIYFSFSRDDCLDEPVLFPVLFIPEKNTGITGIIENKNEKRLQEISNKHGLQLNIPGRIIGEQKLVFSIDGNEECSIPGALMSQSFEKTSTSSHIDNGSNTKDFDTNTIPEPEDITQVAKKMMDYSGPIAKNMFLQKFDNKVGGRVLSDMSYQLPAIIKTFGEKYALASTDEMVFIRTGQSVEKQILIAVSRAIKRIVCCGAVPQQIQFTYNNQSYQKILEANTERIENVYNIKTGYLGYQPLPLTNNCSAITINVNGFIPEKKNYCTPDFKQKGDMVYIIGDPINDIASSVYLSYIYGITASPPAWFDLFLDSKLKHALQDVIQKGLIKSAHSIQEGGIFMTLVESSIENNLGFDITCPAEVRTDAFLFGESPLISLVSVDQKKETAFIDQLMAHKMPFYALGHVTREELRIDDISLGFILDYKRKYSRIQ